MNRGSLVLSPKYEAWREASMRPRFMNRGSPLRVAVSFVPILRFNEAPIHESGK